MTSIYFHNQPFTLESGAKLDSFELAYTTKGQLNETKTNVVWICHALTGNSNPESWWPGIIGKDKAIDPSKHFIVCTNVLGSCYGSTGPLSLERKTQKPYFHKFPFLTNRDIVRSFDLLRQHLQIESIEFLIGGSLGGQHALEWSIYKPDLIKNQALIAANAKHSPWGIAFNESQRLAISSDKTWAESNENAGKKGLLAARSIALLSYRNYNTYNNTQLDNNEKTDSFNAASYQRYQGQKFINRFNAFSYWILSKAMDSHNVSRGRISLANALGNINAKTLVIAISSDILFPVEESVLLAENINNSKLKIIDSNYGHDGFLIETEQINNIIKQTFISNLKQTKS